MARFVIEGGAPLYGTLRVQGAKNAALPILAASIMSRGSVTLQNCPDILDVDNMLEILSELGATARRGEGGVEICAKDADGCVMPHRLSKRLRSSIFMLGPLLARFGRAVCTYPGGCEIGNRPIDLHLKGLAALGVDITEERGIIRCDGERMRGAGIHLDYPSVGATENIMMAAVAAEGDTFITNAAREPEIEDLQGFLNSIGCRVEGAGTSSIHVRGGLDCTRDTVYRIMPDRIVSGTLMCAVAMAGGEVRLQNACAGHIGSVMAKLREAGCEIECGKDIIVSMHRRPSEIKIIETLPYPGFPTDMQAQFFALCSIAEGTSIIVENVFENRYRYCSELMKMGAYFTQKDRTAVIRGVKRLSGATVTASDLRGGAALALAGLAAEGVTTIENAELIERGYERLDELLCSAGAAVIRED